MSDVRWTACEGKALLILTAVFLAGIASGGVAMHVFEAHRTMASAAGSVEQTAEDEYRSQSAVAVEKLKAELALDEEQTQRVRLILDESIMAEADLLMQMRQIQQKGRDKIIDLLRPEQRSRFQTIFEQVSNSQ